MIKKKNDSDKNSFTFGLMHTHGIIIIVVLEIFQTLRHHELKLKKKHCILYETITFVAMLSVVFVRVHY